MSDPVAAKSGFLCMYMSSHPDTLVAYAKHFGKVNETVKSAQMTSIDTKGMDLKCTLSNGSVKEVRVPIEPPLKGYDDVKPRLLEMKAIAQESLGMIKTPKITSFELPRSSAITIVPIVCFAYTLAPIYFTVPPETAGFFSLTNNYLRPFFGDWLLQQILYGAAAFHGVEALFVAYLARKHAASVGVGLSYVLGTFALGGPILGAFRRKIQEARINSVMKVE